MAEKLQSPYRTAVATRELAFNGAGI